MASTVLIPIDAAALREDYNPTFNRDILEVVRHCHEYVGGDLLQKAHGNEVLKGIEGFYAPRSTAITTTDLPLYAPLKHLVSLLPIFREQFNRLRPEQRRVVGSLEETAVSMIRSNMLYDTLITRLQYENKANH